MRGVLLVLTGLLAAGPSLSQDPEPAAAPIPPVESLSPLTQEERTALESAIDGRDHQESAFAALLAAMSRVEPARIDLESLETWSPARFKAALAEPDAQRGAPALLVGRLEQSVPLERPWSGFLEWFVRVPGVGAVTIYVPREDDVAFGEGVRVVGRFYKRIEATARDGEYRAYPAFVGRSVAVAPGRDPTFLLVMLVVVLLAGWLLLLLLVRRARSSRQIRSTPAIGTLETDPELTGLPSDPVAALDELARRSDDRERKGDS